MDYQSGNRQNGPGNGYNPYNPYNPYNTPLQPVPVRPRGESLATASMVLGIISLVSLLLLQISIPLLVGSLGIVLAILSKGNAKKAVGRAKAGMICCIVSLSLDIVLCVSAIWLVFSLPNLSPELKEEVNKACEETYGVSYDEMMDEMMDEINDIWNDTGY